VNRNNPNPVFAAASIAAALALGACSWGTFDSLANKAWVDSSGSPGNLNADDYGVAVAYGGAPDPEGVFFVAVGLRPDGVAMVTFDSAGKRGTNGQTIDDLGSNPDPLPSRPALAGDLTSSRGAVGLGLSEEGGTKGRVVVFEPEGPEAIGSISVGDELVNALAFGPTNHPDDLDETDMVATTGDLLTLVTFYSGESAERTQNECQIDREVAFDIAIADLDTGIDKDEIAIAIGNASKDGAASEIQIITGTLVQAAAAAGEPCVSSGSRDPLAVLAAPGDEPDFGSQIEVADFDGNGTPDLAASAPSTGKVYVYLNVDLDGGAPSSPDEIDAPAGPGSFGEAMASGDFDDDGEFELVVGDSGARVNDVARAGQAYIYNKSFGNPIQLNDAQPEEAQRFGRTLAVGYFGPSEESVLCVGAVDELFTYFRTPVAGDSDVRQ